MTYQAVLFDCDGVLVDSEPITVRVLRDCLQERGWTLSYDECYQIFIGKAVRDERDRIEKETGQPFTEEWMAYFYGLRNVQLQAHVLAIPDAVEAVRQVHQHFNGRIACASGADRFKLNLQLTKVGLSHFFGDRIHSGQEQARNKPFPDVYLAAAAALGIAPAHCLVVEDSPTGIAAGVAAGATVIGFAPTAHANDAALLSAGARMTIQSMAQLPTAIAQLQSQATQAP